MKFRHILTGMSLLLAADAMAVGAKQGLITLTQPDGTRIEAYLEGDEAFHYYTDAAGNLLQADSGGFLRKADASDWLEAKRAVAKARRNADSKYTSYPTKGHQKALVMLVNFADNSFTFGHDYFERMLNATDYGSWGSARDYYIENSGGNFIPEFDVYGPVTLANRMTYYSANDDEKAYEMVVEACRQLDGEINFADYDRDGDGWVDNIYVFYAGYGEADGGGINTVWPHSANVYRKGATLLLDGVQIGQYACSNELEANTRNLVGIGTFCHEFGHVLGLPDLYSTNGASVVTPGYWSIMDHGNYANGGKTPVALTAYERYFLGWTEPIVIEGDAAGLLPEIAENIAYRINGADPEEYFLLENRRKSGWDTYAPGEGLLVWHIDYDRDQWNLNSPNNDATHQRVRILPADGTNTTQGDAGDTYPGTANVTSIQDFRSWNGASAGIRLSDISKDGAYVTFRVNGGGTEPPAPAVTISGITDCEATATIAEPAVTLLTLQYTEEGRTRHAYGYSALSTGNAGTTELTGLEPETGYTLKAYRLDGCSLSLPAQKTFTTLAPGIRFFAPEGLAATDITSTGFTLSWNEVATATEYFVSICHEGEGAASAVTIDFADKTNLPQGWTTTATNTMSVGGYYGEAAPSLRMANNAEIIESPEFGSAAKTLTLWMRGYQAAPAASIEIYGKCSGEWTKIATISNIDNSSGKTYSYSEAELNDAMAIRITYVSPTGTGSVCIDDIRVGLGNETVTVYDLENVSAGADCMKTIDGLRPGVDYYVTVTATDGHHTSKVSEILTVTTAKSNCVAEELAEGNASVEVYSTSGFLLYKGEGVESLPLPKGIYVMRQGTATRKIYITK